MADTSFTRASFENNYGYAPKKGPRSLLIQPAFVSGQDYLIDLSMVQEQDQLEFVGSVYIDNAANANPVSLTFGTTGQIIKMPGGYQGYLPVLCPNPPRIAVSTTGTPTVKIQFLSYAVPAFIWPGDPSAASIAATVTMAGSTGTDFSANKPSLTGLTLLSTIPVNLTRHAVGVQNQDGYVLTVVRDDGAGGNITILELASGIGGSNFPGESWESNTFKGRIRIYGFSAAIQFAAWED